MNRRERSLQKLRALISSGQYPLQSKLPPERELCLMLNLSRSALREGLEVLEAEGRIWRHVGKGTFVGERKGRELADLSQLSAMCSPDSVIEARLLIEPIVARLAAMRATAAEVDQIRHWQEKSAGARDIKTWELWEGTLHRSIAQAAHNDFLLAIFDTFFELRGTTPWGELRWAPLTVERKAFYSQQHATVVEAITRRDAKRAEEAMHTHMVAVRNDILYFGPEPQTKGDALLPVEAELPLDVNSNNESDSRR